MAESVVCNVCGSTNRAKAKFCTGCARPLPGFEPSGPAMLDPVMSLRPAASEARTRDDGTVPVLPAETAAFWLRAAYVALAMIVGFTLWCLYVTNKPGAPPLKAEIMSLLAPVMSTSPSSAPTAPATPAPAVSEAPGGAADDATSPVHALLPGRPGVPAQSSQPTVEPPVASPSSAKTDAKPATKSTKRSSYASRADRDRIDGPSGNPIDPAPARRSGERDPGPPIAVGPGPLYDYSRQPAGAALAASSNVSPSRQAVPDPGPPIIPGPGPRYDARFDAVRAPPQSATLPSNDPGPPIAVGPGPLVDYSTRGAGGR